MKRLEAKMLEYAAYHRHPKTKLTHFFGVPLVTYAIFLMMAWFRFIEPSVPISLATVFYVAVFIHYLRLDWVVALLQVPPTFTLLWLAERAATLPFIQSFGVFVATMVVGVALQLLGHHYEGRKPAALDNFSQVFNAPVFLVCEVMYSLGFRREQKRRVEDISNQPSAPASK